MTDREVYTNPPLVLAVMEARHPKVRPLSHGATVNAKRLLKDTFPVARQAELTTVQGAIGGPSEMSTELAPKFMTRDRTAAVTFKSEAVVFETTSYRGVKSFQDVVERIVDIRQQVEPVDGLERLGIRYVNEIRIASVTSITDWSEWLDPVLTSVADKFVEANLAPLQALGVAQYLTGPGTLATLRYGPREGFAVAPGGDLKRATPAPGPFFLLDIDSFWAVDEEMPELSVDLVHGLFERLHAPCKTIFEGLLRDNLREVFRG